jgi:outer membrane protein assembly factor BamB
MARGRSCRVLLLAAALVAAGCSSTPDTTKPKLLAEIASPVPVQEIWRRGFAAGDIYVFHPSVRGTTVFVAGADGQVVRFDEGQQTWSVSPVKALSGGVAANERMLIVGTLKGEVLAISPDDGSVVWRSQVGAEVVAPAAFSDDLVIVRTGDNRIFALDARDGRRRWVYQRPNPPLSIRVTSAPVVADRLVFSGYPGGKLVAVSAQNGQVVWEGTVALPKGATELDRMADVVASPVLGAKEICAVAHLGRVTCFDLIGGTQIWTREVSSTAGLAIDHKAVYVSDDQGVVHAFDRVSGGTLWKQDKLQNRRLTAPFLNQGFVVVADDQGLMHVLDRESGAFRGRFSLEAGRIDSEFRAYEGGFVMLTRKGLLVAMQIAP